MLACASSAKVADATPEARTTSKDKGAEKTMNDNTPERPHFFVTTKSSHSLEETLEKVRAAIAKRPLKLFAEIDHAAGAKGAGLAMPASVLFIFGNPKGGTPLMLKNPDMALELPLRLLVREGDGGVVVVYRDPVELAPHYGIDPKQQPVPKIAPMLSGLVAEVTAKD